MHKWTFINEVTGDIVEIVTESRVVILREKASDWFMYRDIALQYNGDSVIELEGVDIGSNSLTYYGNEKGIQIEFTDPIDWEMPAEQQVHDSTCALLLYGTRLDYADDIPESVRTMCLDNEAQYYDLEDGQFVPVNYA